MSQHFIRHLDRLKAMILSFGDTVENAVRDAITAIQHRDVPLAQKVIAGDKEIDQTEIDVEEECLHALACYQPVAMDLRYIVAVLKINNDLERIADMAVNLAEQAQFLAEGPVLDELPFDLVAMEANVQMMLRESLQALVHSDAELARRVCQADDRVDAVHRGAYDTVAREIRERPHLVETYIHMLSISRQLERIADHATNIAEDVIYLVEGEIPRHTLASRRHQSEVEKA